MIILIEGPDGSGKSTLIDGLIPLLPKPRIKLNFRYPHEESVEENLAYARGEYESTIRNLFKELKSTHSIICDRFHLGEYVYGPVMRNYPGHSALNTLRRIEWTLLGLEEVKLIVLNSSLTHVPAMFIRTANDDYIKSLDDYRRICTRYRMAFLISALPKICIDAISLSPREALFEAVKFLGLDKHE